MGFPSHTSSHPLIPSTLWSQGCPRSVHLREDNSYSRCNTDKTVITLCFSNPVIYMRVDDVYDGGGRTGTELQWGSATHMWVKYMTYDQSWQRLWQQRLWHCWWHACNGWLLLLQQMVLVVQHHVNTMRMIWFSLVISAVTSSIASASHRASRVISPVLKVSIVLSSRSGWVALSSFYLDTSLI